MCPHLKAHVRTCEWAQTCEETDVWLVRPSRTPFLHKFICMIDIFLSSLLLIDVVCFKLLFTSLKCLIKYIRHTWARIKTVNDYHQAARHTLITSPQLLQQHWLPLHAGSSPGRCKLVTAVWQSCPREHALWLAASEETRSLIDCCVSLSFKCTKDNDGIVSNRGFVQSPIGGLRPNMGLYDWWICVLRECHLWARRLEEGVKLKLDTTKYH